MKEEDRLSQIETLWSVVLDANAQSATARFQAQSQLLARYGAAIQRYLLGALRDSNAAEDAYQEFAVKFLKGDFRNASPEKGRFRGFLKVVLSRIVANHYRSMTRKPTAQLDSAYQVADPLPNDQWEQEFFTAWRDQMLAEAWSRMGEEELQSQRPWMTVLRLRVENPEWNSIELAGELAERIDQSITPARVRVILHRAREKFANYLIDAVSDTLRVDSLDEVEEELAELKLLQYCQRAIEKRRKEKSE
jgi:DNA-directed RNA polymerase specialized sigma24 family protein